MPIINYVGLALLFFSILYSGRQIGLYIRISRRMGKLVYALSPSERQKKLILGVGFAFLIVLAFVVYSYLTSGVSLNTTFTVLLAVVIYSTGSFTSKVTELRDGGIMGHLNEIAYDEIKGYKVENAGSKTTLTFKLKDNREFVTLIGKNESDNVATVLQKYLG